MRVLLTTLYPYVFLALYLSIPFDNYFRALPNILLGILVAAFFVVVKKSDFSKLKKAAAFPLACLIAYIAISSGLADRLHQDWSEISKILLALGLVVLYLPIRDMTPLNNAVIFSSLAAIIFSVVNMFILVNISEDVALDFPRQVVEALLIDRIYLGMLAIFSILISYQSITRKYHPNNRYHLVNIVVNILFIGLMLSKIALIILLFLMVVKQIYSRRWLLRTSIAVLAALVLAILVVLPLSNPGDAESPSGSSSVERLLDNTFTWQLRRTVWGCVRQVMDDSPINWTGYGAQQTREKLLSCYEQLEKRQQRQEFVIGRYNTHNQFFDLYLAFGLIAVLLFMAFFVLAFARNHRHFVPTAFLIALFVFCLVENVFYRQIGSYYAGLMLIIILSSYEFLNNKELEKHD